MSSSRRYQVTLRRLLALNGVFALLFGAYRLGVAGLAENGRVLAVAWAVLTVLLVLNAVLDQALGTRCPHCRGMSLRRLAGPVSRTAYYSCARCGSRLKRASLLAPWEDASGPEDVARYGRKRGRGKWLGYATPEGGDTTCGRLLLSKRGRGTPPAASGPGPPDASPR